MKKIIILLILCIPVNMFAWPDKFDKKDYALQTTLFFMTFIDTWQTSYTLHHRKDVFESNPLLSKRPSDPELLLFSCSMFISNTIITYLIPQKYGLRTIWQSMNIGSKTGTIYKNFGIMLRF